MSKFSFISGLENDPPKHKKSFQLVEVQMGFEKIKALFPLEQVDQFIKEAEMKKPKSRSSLLPIIQKYNGELE